MGYLSSRDRYVKDLPIKLGPNPPHVCVPPKRNPPFKVRRRRVLRGVRRIQAKRRWVRVPPVGGDDQQPTAAGGDSYGRMVEMGHAGRGCQQTYTCERATTHRQTSMYSSGRTSTLTLGLSSPRGSFAGRKGYAYGRAEGELGGVWICGGCGGGGPASAAFAVDDSARTGASREPAGTKLGRSRGESRDAWRLPQDGRRGGGGGRGSRDENEERAVLGEWTSAGVDGRDMLSADSSIGSGSGSGDVACVVVGGSAGFGFDPG